MCLFTIEEKISMLMAIWEQLELSNSCQLFFLLYLNVFLEDPLLFQGFKSSGFEYCLIWQDIIGIHRNYFAFLSVAIFKNSKVILGNIVFYWVFHFWKLILWQICLSWQLDVNSMYILSFIFIVTSQSVCKISLKFQI